MQYGIEMPKQDDRPRSGTCMTAAEAAAAEGAASVYSCEGINSSTLSNAFGNQVTY
jgi:hypothetical protein